MMRTSAAHEVSSRRSAAPSTQNAAVVPAREGWSGPLGLELGIRVLGSHPYGIIVARRDGSVVAHNPAAAELLGELAERLQDRNDRVLRHVLGCRAAAAPLDGLSLIERAVEAGRVLPESGSTSHRGRRRRRRA
jgi:PAS domain-containing protein